MSKDIPYGSTQISEAFALMALISKGLPEPHAIRLIQGLRDSLDRGAKTPQEVGAILQALIGADVIEVRAPEMSDNVYQLFANSKPNQ